MGVVETAAPDAKVWNRIRISTTDKGYVQLYVDEDEQVNVWFVRRVGVRDEVSSFDDFISETHTYELRHFRSRVDSETASLASETVFQADIETMRAAFRADKNIGLDPGTTHSGLQILEPIPLSAQLDSYEGHLCVARLEVNVAEC